MNELITSAAKTGNSTVNIEEKVDAISKKYSCLEFTTQGY